MKHLRVAFTTVALFLLLPLAFPSRAVAQLDHLLCHRMVDKLQVQSALSLFAELQPEFDQQGCELIRPFEFCVPVTKLNVLPPPSGPPIVGQPLKDDYVCYLLKCPDKPIVPSRIVADQFGRRLLRKFKPYKVCVPAQKAPPPCGPTTSPRQCGGTCDDPAGLCHYDKVAKLCTCAPPQLCGGKPDAVGQCGGQCPANQACLPFLQGTTQVICRCQDPPPPLCDLNAATGTCGGTCQNANDKCSFLPAPINDCRCLPVDQGCPTNPPAGGTCGGTCTDATLTCERDPLTNQCRCQPPPQNCGPNPATGQCGGTCTAGTCKFISAGTTGVCQCQ